MNHFETMGLIRGLDFKPGELDARFRELSLKYHPDKFATAEPKERRIALEKTTALNDAYQTLRDPVRRAFYLLKLHGVDLDREDGGTQKDLPLEILEDVIERREALDIARKARDVVKARQLADAVRRVLENALAQGETELRKLESGNGAPETLQRASHALAQVRYFTRFLEEVDAIEEEVLQ